jgi:hypothetical protein
MHMALQAVPDAMCQQWLDSPAGQEYQQCDSGNPGLPVPYNQTNNCELTFEDFEGYCNNSCYGVMVKAWEFFLNTSTCLDVEQDKYKACMNDSDCVTVNGRQRVCFEGFCYNACNSTSDCNPCMEETCVPLGGNNTQAINNTGSQGTNSTGSQGTNSTGSQGNNGTSIQACRSARIVYANGSAVVANRTIQNTFRAQLYKLQAGCSKSENNVYCGLIDLSNQTCASLKSQWGCCASTLLPSIKYCEWLNFTNSTINNLLTNCTWDIAPCGGLDWAWQFCGFNVSGGSSSSSSSSGISGTNSSSGSSSIIGTNSSSSSIIGTNSSSSSMIGTNSSSSSNIVGTNSSSSSIIGTNSSSSGSSSIIGISGNSSSLSSGIGGGNPGNNNTASAKATISWTMTIALVLAAANVAC